MADSANPELSVIANPEAFAAVPPQPQDAAEGEADPLVPVAAAEELAKLIPNAELRLLPGLGHNIPDAVVPEFVDAISAAADRAAHTPAAQCLHPSSQCR